MPYSKISELPDPVKKLPEHAQAIWMAAFNSAYEQHKDEKDVEQKAFAIAWAAIKTKYEQDKDGNWKEKKDEEIQEKREMEIRSLTHNSTVADNEPDWGSVDKTKLPRNAFAREGEPDKKSTWGFPHHWVKGGEVGDGDVYTSGTLYLHQGGLNAAWAAAQGAHSGEKAEASVIAHLNAHRKALGLEEKKDDEEFVTRNIKTHKFYRSLELPENSIDEANRRVNMTFSSELPVLRDFGYEILDHDPKSVNLDHVRGGSLLVDHDPKDLVGKVEEVSIGDDRRGHSTVRFGKSARANEIFGDVVDKIRDKSSVGYRIDSLKFEREEEGQKYYRATWTPLELSLVAVPADDTVGVGRANTENEFDTKVIEPATEKINNSENKDDNKSVEKRNYKMEKMLEDIRREETERVAAIRSAGKEYSMPQEMIDEHVAKGTSKEDFRLAILEKMKVIKPVTIQPELGLSDRETKEFSVRKAILAIAEGTWEKGSFEKETSDALVKKYGRSTNGFFVPYEVQKRAFDYGTGAGGGYGNYTVMTTAGGMSMIEMLYNKLLLRQLGTTILGGLVGNIAVPKHLSGPTCYWVTEGSAPTEGLPVMGQLTFTPKTVGAFVPFTRQLLIQSSLDIEAFVRSAIAGNIAVGIDTACFEGGGSGEPNGLMSGSISGIGTVSAGTAAVPTWANIVELETDVEVANALSGTLAYVTTPEVRGLLKQTVRHATNPVGFIWNDDNQINGYPAYASNVVPKDLEDNGETDLHGLIFGDWTEAVLAMWGTLEVTVDPYTLSTAGSVRVTGLQSLDFGVKHAGAFSFQKADLE
jgi:HK97 family phage major capsid protein